MFLGLNTLFCHHGSIYILYITEDCITLDISLATTTCNEIFNKFRHRTSDVKGNEIIIVHKLHHSIRASINSN